MEDDKIKEQEELKALLNAPDEGGDWRVSLLAGYAGTDFLEGLYRLKFSQFFKLQ
mgnify:CR=1 FL=1